MTSKEAIETARNVFLFENGEETDEWSRSVIEGLKQAEEDLEMLELVKRYLAVDPNIIFGEGEKIEKIRKWLENDK